MKTVLASCLLLLLWSCSSEEVTKNYRAHLLINDSLSIPFMLHFHPSTSTYTVSNANELIDQLTPSKIGDSIDLEHPVFDSHLRFIVENDSLRGYWYNGEKGDYKMGFHAELNETRFDHNYGNTDPSGTWAVTFGEGDEITPAVGIFELKDNSVEGTFLTETGDYRYLAGAMNGDSLLLSTFDFAHAFLFLANIENNEVSGTFYSGHHWEEHWEGHIAEDAKLRNALDLVSINDSLEGDFLFKGLSGETIDIDHALFKDKAIVIQLFGSWCPNCYDESVFLNSLYESQKYKDVCIIGVGFERRKTFEEAKLKIEKFRSGLDIKYPLAYGGYADKNAAKLNFPALDKVIAFPSMIFYDKDHHLVAVHSGFSGPGTGKYYLESKREIVELINIIQE